MKDQRLERAFNPRSIAVVGISGGLISMGRSYVEHLIKLGFPGPIYPITAKESEVLGRKAYPSLKEVPEPVDYVICCLPAAGVLDLLTECADKRVKVIHLFTARFSETGRGEETELEGRILERVRHLGLGLIGPNCMGIYHPKAGISFAYGFPSEPGKLGMFLQSGGAASEFIYYARLRGLRFSKVISYGNALDLDESECLDYLAQDEETGIIAGYIEGTRDGRKFIKSLARAARIKPVILLKAGRGRAGSASAASHTAAMAGALDIWRAVFRQAGAMEAGSLEDMVDLAVSFYHLPPIRGNRVGVIGGGGGISVLSADEWEEGGFEVAPLAPEIEALIRTRLPGLWQGWLRNPLDLSIMPLDATMASLSGDILKMMARSPDYDLVAANIIIGGPFSNEQLRIHIQRQVRDILAAHREGTNPVAVILNTGTLSLDDFQDGRMRSLAEAVQALVPAGVPVYAEASRAAGAIIRLIDFFKKRSSLIPGPAGID